MVFLYGERDDNKISGWGVGKIDKRLMRLRGGGAGVEKSGWVIQMNIVTEGGRVFLRVT